MVVLKEEIFNSFYIWEGVVVLKEEIFNSFYLFGKDVVVLKEQIFNSFHIWVDVVVLKEEIFNSFHILRMWWSSWKKRFLTVSPLGGCGGLEITDF